MIARSISPFVHASSSPCSLRSRYGMPFNPRINALLNARYVVEALAAVETVKRGHAEVQATGGMKEISRVQIARKPVRHSDPAGMLELMAREAIG